MRGAAGAFAVASLLTLLVAAPVVLAPTERIFGSEIVGRHHDPFTVMRQMAERGPSAPFIQPATDWTGWLLARALHPVAAYNVLVLLTFPLAAAATFALGRYLGASTGASLFAGLAFSFAPLHLAHAAYHPHIAQVQWLPVYLLAIFAAVDRATPLRLALATGAGALLFLSNFYGGLIGAVLTPMALVSYALSTRRTDRPLRNAAITCAVLAAVALAGAAATTLVVPQLSERALSALTFPSSDVTLYSARWWAFFVPPVDHPLFGTHAADVHRRAGVAAELLEQQVYVGLALAGLGAVAIGAAIAGWRSNPERRVWIGVGAIGLCAALVAIGPAGAACEQTPWAPACALHSALPMFRSYARFALVTHLAVALLAGAGASWLARRSPKGAAIVSCLIAISVIEYLPFPWRSRDVLPTAAHRWLAHRDPDQKTLDCVRPSLADLNLAWLMQRQVTMVGGEIATCNDPAVGSLLAASGYTHLIVRQPDGGEWLPGLRPDGLAHAVTFPDSTVYRVVATVPPVLTVRWSGFHAFETDGAGDVWRWMPSEAQWLVRNTAGRPVRASLVVDLQSATGARSLAAVMDDAEAQIAEVDITVERRVFGPWVLTPGDHHLVFKADGPLLRPIDVGHSTDTRNLAVSFRRVSWLSEPLNDEIR